MAPSNSNGGVGGALWRSLLGLTGLANFPMVGHPETGFRRALGREVGVPSLWPRLGGVLQQHGLVVFRPSGGANAVAGWWSTDLWMSHAVTSRIVFELVFHALTSGITTAPTPIR
jgi:hypothetical protein